MTSTRSSPGIEPCPSCWGAGYWGKYHGKCLRCNGTGRAQIEDRNVISEGGLCSLIMLWLLFGLVFVLLMLFKTDWLFARENLWRLGIAVVIVVGPPAYFLYLWGSRLEREAKEQKDKEGKE